MTMNFIRRGEGKPLLLLHGLGGSWRSWSTLLDGLAAERDVIAVDLPGFGDTPPLPGEVSIATLADAVTEFMHEQNLNGVDVVGSSMGARLVLELARRGVVGNVVSLDPGGFWQGWERTVFSTSVALSVRLVRLLQPVMPFLTGNPITRTLLFAQFSAHPWALSPSVSLAEMRSFATAKSFDPLLTSLVKGPAQQGIPAGTERKPIVIGWGKRDLVCLPRQAKRAASLFPQAKFHWFTACGHFPQWDSPRETTHLILDSTR